MSNLGYDRKLYILPFDHRGTFADKLYKVPSAQLTPEQHAEIREFKQIIYEAFKQSVKRAIPKEDAAILVDEEYAGSVIKDALSNNYIVLLTLEKSGQKEFDFQYDNWQEHILRLNPPFVKALIRYNPNDPEDLKKRQQEKLKLLSDFVHQNNIKFLLEPLVPATDEQLKSVDNDKDRYDRKLRPSLTVQMISQLQNSSVEVDVWKLEGMYQQKDYENVVNQARVGGRDNVGVVVLGRGAGPEIVEEWLKIGSKVDGVIGFAIGRTIFWDIIVNYHNQQLSREGAVRQISDNFLHFYHVFIGS